MSAKTRGIIGWVLSGLVSLMLLGPSAMSKFFVSAEAEQQFEKMGFKADQMFGIGIVEVVITILYLVPRTSFLGAILLTGYLGGATVTHLRVGEGFAPPVIIGIIMWVGLALRRPVLFRLLFGQWDSPSRPTE